MNGVVLACDIGTSSLKAALIDARGMVVGSARCRFPPGPRRADDWTEALAEAAYLVAPALKASGKTVDAISVSGNGPTLVAVDSRGRALDVLMWNDPIPADATSASDVTPEGAAVPSGGEPKSPSLFIPRLRAYRELFPDAWNGAERILSGPEYLVWYLTGEAVTILPDPRYESAYWTEGDLSLAGIDARRLSPFVVAGSVVAPCGEEARPALAALGAPLSRAVPVVAGGPDFTVALVGTGTIREGTACDRAGTSEGLNVCVANPVRHPLIRPLPAAVEGLWNASYLLPETGARFHEWRARSGMGDRPYAEIMGDVLDDVLNGRESGARAAVESIGRSVREGVAVLREATGFAGEFALSGGQARNAIWNRLKAAMANATFAMMETPDGELMGDAALAYTALGAYRSLAEAVAGMVRVAERHESEGALAAIFDERFANP
jgi:xylulokinase